MNKKILAWGVTLCTVLALAAPGQCATTIIAPDSLIMSAKSVNDGDFVRQDAEGIFVLTSSEYEFWAPLKPAVGSKIKSLAIDDFDVGAHSIAAIYRVSKTVASDPEKIVEVTAGDNPDTNWDKTTVTLPYPYHTVAAGYRYYVKVRLANDCFLGKIYVVR